MVNIIINLEILFGATGKIKKTKLYKDNMNKNKGDALIVYTSTEAAAASAYKVCHWLIIDWKYGTVRWIIAILDLKV